VSKPVTAAGRALHVAMGTAAPWPHPDYVTHCWACKRILAIEAEAAERATAGLREALDHARESLNHIYVVATSHSDYADAVRDIEGEASAAIDGILAALAAQPAAASAEPGLDAQRKVEEAIASWMHANRWCKWSEGGHAMAHDPEDETRPSLARAILAALRAPSAPEGA